MNDIELTEKIKNLKWKIDLENGTCESELVHYKIIQKKNYTDLKMVWISHDFPAVTAVINEMQGYAVAAFRDAINGRG